MCSQHQVGFESSPERVIAFWRHILACLKTPSLQKHRQPRNHKREDDPRKSRITTSYHGQQRSKSRRGRQVWWKQAWWKRVWWKRVWSVERTGATEGYMSDGEKRWAAILPDRHDVSFVWAVCREDSKRLHVAYSIIWVTHLILFMHNITAWQGVCKKGNLISNSAASVYQEIYNHRYTAYFPTLNWFGRPRLIRPGMIGGAQWSRGCLSVERSNFILESSKSIESVVMVEEYPREMKINRETPLCN